MAILARLGVVLGLNSTEFKAGLDDATKNLKQFENNAKRQAKQAQQAQAEMLGMLGKMAGAAAIAGAGIYKLFEKADNITDMAAAFDSSIGSIVGMGKALEQSGGKAENLGTMLSKLTVSAQGAKDGSDSLRDSFKQIGVAAGEVENLNPDELLERVAIQLAKIPDATERNAKAVELLGKAAKGIDWAKYVDEYKRMDDPELVEALKAAGDAFDNIAAGVSHTYYFLIKLIKPFADIVNGFAKIRQDYLDIKQNGGDINFDLENPMSEGQSFAAPAKATVPEKAKTAQQKKAEAQGDSYKKLSDKQKQIAEKEKEMLWAAKQISIEFERQQKFAMQQLDTRIKMHDMTQDERKVQETVNQVLDATSRKIDEITKKREDAIGRGANQKVIDEYNAQIEVVQKLGDTYVETARKKEEAAIAEQRTFEYGWNKAFKQYAEDAYNYGKMGGDMFRSITDNMTDALDTFVETGKINFASFTRSILMDLIKIQLRMQMMQLFSSAIGMIGGSFSSTSVATGGSGGGGSFSGSGDFSMQKFADGGTPPLNQPSLVGENGPELFIPRTSGSIIPNNSLGSMLGGGGGQTVNYNGPYIASMSAIDTQSATQFLSKNKTAVWAANMSASRGIPASR